jgi:FkbM family methyltransferase
MNARKAICRLRAAIGWRLSRLWWGIRSIPRRRTVRVKRLGLDLELCLRDNSQYFVYSQGSYEPNLSELIRRELRPGDVYVDIGAHVGIHALVAARDLQRLGEGHVFAFEPTTDSANRLAKAAERNGIRNLTLVRAAVGETAGRIELRAGGPFGADIPGMRSAFLPGRVVESVPVVCLDRWARDTSLTRVDLIKLDIEGGELAALVGMRETLARLRPRLLLVEVNPVTLARAGVTKEELYSELAQSGYAPAETIRDHESIENVVFAPSDQGR